MKRSHYEKSRRVSSVGRGSERKGGGLLREVMGRSWVGP